MVELRLTAGDRCDDDCRPPRIFRSSTTAAAAVRCEEALVGLDRARRAAERDGLSSTCDDVSSVRRTLFDAIVTTTTTTIRRER